MGATDLSRTNPFLPRLIEPSFKESDKVERNPE
jgi:hypothetical protein